MHPRAYYWTEGDEIVVQNWIGSYLGQEHRHSPADFERWADDARRTGWILVPLAEPNLVGAP